MIMQLRSELEEVKNDKPRTLDPVAKIIAHRPEPYDGNKEGLRPFITQANAYLKVNSDSFEYMHQKVMCVAGMLKGRAAEWFEPTLRDFLDHKKGERKAETQAIFDNANKFWDKLRETFGNPDEKRAAERQMLSLRQKGSAGGYAADFKRISARLDWGEEALLVQFYSGLRDNVKDELSKEDRPKTLHEYITKVIKIDNRLYERQLERKRGGASWSRTSPVANTGQRRSTAYGHHSGPMDLDATQRSNPKNQTKKGKCFNCGKQGHYANTCRQPKKTWNPVPERRAQAATKDDGSRTIAMMRRESTLGRGRPGQELDVIVVPGYNVLLRPEYLISLLDLEWEEDEGAQGPVFGDHEALALGSRYHHELAWTSCVWHRCPDHFFEKADARWLPTKKPWSRPLPHPHTRYDLIGYTEVYRSKDYLYLAPQGTFIPGSIRDELDEGRPPAAWLERLYSQTPRVRFQEPPSTGPSTSRRAPRRRTPHPTSLGAVNRITHDCHSDDEPEGTDWIHEDIPEEAQQDTTLEAMRKEIEENPDPSPDYERPAGQQGEVPWPVAILQEDLRRAREEAGTNEDSTSTPHQPQHYGVPLRSSRKTRNDKRRL